MSQSSQGSDASFPVLSQGTITHILGSVGMESEAGNVLTNCYSYTLDEDDDADLGEGLEAEPAVGSSSISMRRAVFTSRGDPQLMGWGADSQNSFNSFEGGHHGICNGEPAAAVTSTFDKSPTPQPLGQPLSLAFSPLCQPSSSGLPDDSPLATPTNPLCLHPTTLTPPTPVTPASAPMTPGPMTPYGGIGVSLPGCSSAVPCNVTQPGEFGFKLIDFEMAENRFKNSNIIYSTVTQRAYIKQATIVPFYFIVSGAPPSQSIVRAMCIHTAPENIADNLVCCPKHHDINQRKGLLQPAYFIRPAENDNVSSFWRDQDTSRLSIMTPFTSLQKNCECRTGLYMFPCHTSDFSKTGQFVQVIFTLECEGEVLGRAILDIRVCASPGRDRDTDHGKKRRTSSTKQEEAASPHVPTALQNGRKRANPAQVEVTKCTVPPKKTCHGLSRQKVRYVIETYPEVIPYIDVCVQMLERVQGVNGAPPPTVQRQNSASAQPPLQRQNSASAQPPLQRMDTQPVTQPSFETLESWLEHLGLLRHHKILREHGVTDTAQVLTVTDEELKGWGVRVAAHRKKFLDGKALIHPHEPPEEEHSPPLFGPSPPPAAGPSGTQESHTLTQSFEVVEITVKKSLSSSSSSSNTSNNLF